MLRSLVLACALVTLLAAALAQSPQWQAGAAYAVGAKVAYAGAEYRCLQAHTAQVGWEPSTTLALWSPTATVTTGSFPATPATIAPTTAPATAAPVGVGCWPLWSASAIYVGGATVSYGNVNYRAAWWTQGDVPPTHTGSGQPWVSAGACGGGAAPATSAPAPSPATLPPPPPPPATNAPATVRPTTPAPVTAAPVNPAPTNGSLPKRVITGYWQNFNNGATCLRLSAVPSAYNLIAVAFASSTALPGEITFTVDSGLASCLGGYTDEQFIADVRTAHAKGQKVIISIGGELGHLIVNDATSAARFADSAFAVMTRFGFDGVDIDLESGINPGALASGLRLLAAKAPGLVITTAPQTLDMQTVGSAYMDLSMRIRDLLTISNTQFYNSGSMLGCDGGIYVQGSVDFLTAQACIQLRAGLRPDQIGLGLPASVRGAGSGYIAPSMVVSALRCLALGEQCGAFRPSALAPAIRGAMTWSINWDALNGYQWVNTIAAGLAALP